jgi:hypothetical protein
VKVPHLASHLLARITRRISADWQELYHHPGPFAGELRGHRTFPRHHLPGDQLDLPGPFEGSGDKIQTRRPGHLHQGAVGPSPAPRLPPTLTGMSLLEQIQTLIGSVEDRQSFLQRIRQLVSPTDLQRIEAMQGLLLETGGVLEQYQRRNGKLRRALFGAKTEKTAKVGSVANPPLARTKPKRKGHGRRGAAQYTEARRVEVCHPSLKAWQVCGKCIQRPSGQAVHRRRGESVGPQIHQVGRMAGRIHLQFRDRAKNL